MEDFIDLVLKDALHPETTLVGSQTRRRVIEAALAGRPLAEEFVELEGGADLSLWEALKMLYEGAAAAFTLFQIWERFGVPLLKSLGDDHQKRVTALVEHARKDPQYKDFSDEQLTALASAVIKLVKPAPRS